ncbi:MAG: hypothetical protein IJ228_06775 [Succinivibrio sp.]|nr:hypothetical protein [Succinivibrio sp.]
MSMTVDNNGNISGVGLNVNGEKLDTNQSIQFIFAQLQNELAKANKDKALGIINEIKDQQNQAKQYAEILNYARTTRAKTDSDGYVKIDSNSDGEWAKVATWCRENGISKDLYDNWPNGKAGTTKLDNIIEIIKSKQEQCGSDIQQKMVFVQDYIGQYNAYQQGASTAISQANQTLTSLAKGQ